MLAFAQNTIKIDCLNRNHLWLLQILPMNKHLAITLDKLQDKHMYASYLPIALSGRQLLPFSTPSTLSVFEGSPSVSSIADLLTGPHLQTLVHFLRDEQVHASN